MTDCSANAKFDDRIYSLSHINGKLSLWHGAFEELDILFKEWWDAMKVTLRGDPYPVIEIIWGLQMIQRGRLTSSNISELSEVEQSCFWGTSDICERILDNIEEGESGDFIVRWMLTKADNYVRKVDILIPVDGSFHESRRHVESKCGNLAINMKEE